MPEGGPERTVSDVVLDRLRAWGVHRIFGYSGDGINGFLGALQRTDGAVELVQARHEESAALMASGHARFTGEVGVVTSTQGPGAIHLLNGLYDAKLDHQPVVAITSASSGCADPARAFGRGAVGQCRAMTPTADQEDPDAASSGGQQEHREPGETSDPGGDSDPGAATGEEQAAANRDRELTD